MTTSRFFLLLGLVTLVAALGVVGCHYLMDIGYALPFSILSGVGLAFICIPLFFLGRRSAGAENKHLFGNVFLGLTMMKMLVCGMLVVGYVVLGEPESKLFIVPFFWLYAVYTSFEVYFLMQLSATVAR
jgi:hypothetical protein